MSKTLVTQWEAYRWCGFTQAYEQVTRSPVGEPILQPVTAHIRLEYEDDVEFPFHVWDKQSETDAAKALQVHGLIECEQEQSSDPFLERVTVIVRDWWSKQTIGKLVCRDELEELEVM